MCACGVLPGHVSCLGMKGSQGWDQLQGSAPICPLNHPGQFFFCLLCPSFPSREQTGSMGMGQWVIGGGVSKTGEEEGAIDMNQNNVCECQM